MSLQSRRPSNLAQGRDDDACVEHVARPCSQQVTLCSVVWKGSSMTSDSFFKLALSMSLPLALARASPLYFAKA
jgi:hypothetical protein